MITLRYIIAVFVLVPSTGVFALAAMISCLFSRRSLPTSVMRNWARYWLWLAGIQLDIKGLEHVDPKKPAIYMANHASIIDIPILIWALPVDLRFIFKKSILYIPLVGLAIFLMGMIPIDRARRSKARESLKKAGDRIRNGSHVLIFPEGTRSHSGDMLPFKKGGFYLAIQEHIDIIPITIRNSRQLCGRNSIMAKSGVIHIAIHERFHTREISLGQRSDAIARVRKIIDTERNTTPQQIKKVAQTQMN